MTGLNYRRDIDGLRAVAVIPVVLNHAGFRLVPGGFIGVDIFFVISGYLITGILAGEIAEGRFSITGFYERRARRILPALFAVLTVCLLGGLLLLPPAPFAAIGRSTIATLLFSSNIWFWNAASDYFGNDMQREALLHTWSLAVEEQFYVGFPLLLWLIAARPRRVWIAIVAALSALSLVLSVWMTGVDPIANFYLAPTRAWELGAGALLALGVLPELRSQGLREVAGALGLLLILGGIALISDETPFPGLAALPPVLGAALLLGAGAGGRSVAGDILSLRPMVWVGLISYSLYLWHWPVIVTARIVTGHDVLLASDAVVCILLSMALGWSSWRYVERPFRRRSGAAARSARTIFAGSALGGALLGSAALAVVAMNGNFGRFPPEHLRIYAAATTRGPLDRRCTDQAESDPPCMVGVQPVSGQPVSVVVWGDSHAGAMLDGFDDWMKREGLSGVAFAHSACAPLLNIRRADQPNSYGCMQHNDRVLSRIEAMPSVQRVIVIGRWAFLAEGTRAPGESGRAALLARGNERPEGIAHNPALLAEGLGAVLDRLSVKGVEVVLVTSVPEAGRDVPETVLRAGSAVDLDALRPSRGSYAARVRQSRPILTDLAKSHGALLVDPAAVLCDATCRLTVDGLPLYRDDDHLSRAGAIWLVPRLMAQVPPIRSAASR